FHLDTDVILIHHAAKKLRLDSVDQKFQMRQVTRSAMIKPLQITKDIAATVYDDIGFASLEDTLPVFCQKRPGKRALSIFKFGSHKIKARWQRLMGSGQGHRPQQ